MAQQENVGESRNLHFTDAADRSRAQGLDQAGSRGKISGRGGPELDPDVEDQYRREKADYLD